MACINEDQIPVEFGGSLQQFSWSWPTNSDISTTDSCIEDEEKELIKKKEVEEKKVETQENKGIQEIEPVVDQEVLSNESNSTVSYIECNSTKDKHSTNIPENKI